jgi:hypothetical protein
MHSDVSMRELYRYAAFVVPDLEGLDTFVTNTGTDSSQSFQLWDEEHMHSDVAMRELYR